MARNVIRDGYTRDGYIEASDGLYEAMTFKYRPMLPQEESAVSVAAGKNPGKEAVLLRAAAIQKALVEWDEVDESGAKVPITVENVRRLPPSLFWRLYGVISGNAPSDPLPKATKEEDDEYTTALLQAAADGVAPGQTQLANDRKN